MIRLSTISSGSAAAAYYGGGNADYYLGEECKAQWHGIAAFKLGLRGEVSQQAFKAIMNNRTPSGEKITPRDHPTRKAGYDLTFSVPKSVTLLNAIAKDPRIDSSLKAAIRDTMLLVERDASTQIRGERKPRRTGNLIWADFTHQTTRPLGGIPDPQLHTHVVVANMTYSAKDGGFRALDTQNIKGGMDYYQAFFRQTLAEQLQSHGYSLKNTGKDFEIEGVPERAIKEFSRRTSQIEALNKKLAAERGYDSLSPEGKAKTKRP